MEEKNKKVQEYITLISIKLNQEYPGIINEEQIVTAILMFKDLELDYDKIKEQIDTLIQRRIGDYKENKIKRFSPDLIKSNHEEIYSKLELLIQKLNSLSIDYQLAGALCTYIKYGEEAKRTHDDIDISLNEEDIDKFELVCHEMGLHFSDGRFNSPRVLKKGIPSGEHEVIGTLPNSEFHIGVFCFERKEDGTVISKGYYRNEDGESCCMNTIYEQPLASEIFGRETVEYRGHSLYITPPEYIYKLKSYTNNEKDRVDLEFMESRIDKEKLSRINELSYLSRKEYEVIGTEKIQSNDTEIDFSR